MNCFAICVIISHLSITCYRNSCRVDACCQFFSFSFFSFSNLLMFFENNFLCLLIYLFLLFRHFFSFSLFLCLFWIKVRVKMCGIANVMKCVRKTFACTLVCHMTTIFSNSAVFCIIWCCCFLSRFPLLIYLWIINLSHSIIWLFIVCCILFWVAAIVITPCTRCHGSIKLKILTFSFCSSIHCSNNSKLTKIFIISFV